MKRPPFIGRRRICYVYREAREGFAVGYYAPTGVWVSESLLADKDAAARRVSYLNGRQQRARA